MMPFTDAEIHDLTEYLCADLGIDTDDEIAAVISEVPLKLLVHMPEHVRPPVALQWLLIYLNRVAATGDTAPLRAVLRACALLRGAIEGDLAVSKDPLASALATVVTYEPAGRYDDEGAGVAVRGAVLPAPPVRLGRFVIERELAQGCVDRRFLGRDVDSGDEVMVQMLSPEHARWRAALAAYLAGALAMEELRARHADAPVAEVLALGMERSPEGPPLAYVVVKRPAGTLRDRLEDGSPEDRLDLVMRGAAALQRIHESGLVHKNVHPDTLAFDAEGRVFWTDVGMVPSGLRGRLDRALYAAPEALRPGGESDRRADQCSLALVAAAALLGGPLPIDALTDRRVFLGLVPRPWRAALLKAAEPDPLQRFRSVGKFGEALKTKKLSDRDARRPRRDGYDHRFLGIELPAPALPMATDALDYARFTVHVNPETGMPRLVAFTLDGAAVRRDALPPGRWFYDARRSLKLALGPEVFHRSGFERGALVPAKLVASGEESERAVSDAHSYSNVVPMVADLARGWRALAESLALHAARGGAGLVGFAGPVVRDDDPVYRGVSIPQQVFLVVFDRPSAGAPWRVGAWLGLQAFRVRDGVVSDSRASVEVATVKQVEQAAGLHFGTVASLATPLLVGVA